RRQLLAFPHQDSAEPVPRLARRDRRFRPELDDERLAVEAHIAFDAQGQPRRLRTGLAVAMGSRRRGPGRGLGDTCGGLAQAFLRHIAGDRRLDALYLPPRDVRAE